MEWSSDGKPLLMAGTHLDITTRKRYEEKLKYLSVHDPLTGLFNRQELRNLLEKEMQRARRYQRDLSVCMIDIDHFKKINDTYGHPVGDKVLTILASIIKKTIRENDIAFRYGGEEFLIVLTETPVPQALSLAERLRKSIEAYEFKDSKEAEFNATVSIGVATFTEQIKSEEELLKTADQALYAAKKAGRNQVMSFEQSLLN
jgi:diguanylate cyclase (GGDEF)-like protein